MTVSAILDERQALLDGLSVMVRTIGIQVDRLAFLTAGLDETIADELARMSTVESSVESSGGRLVQPAARLT